MIMPEWARKRRRRGGDFPDALFRMSRVVLSTASQAEVWPCCGGGGESRSLADALNS
jgi:hypothetical protein